MKLREHPLMICGGIRNWPPVGFGPAEKRMDVPVAKSAF